MPRGRRQRPVAGSLKIEAVNGNPARAALRAEPPSPPRPVPPDSARPSCHAIAPVVPDRTNHWPPMPGLGASFPPRRPAGQAPAVRPLVEGAERLLPLRRALRRWHQAIAAVIREAETWPVRDSIRLDWRAGLAGSDYWIIGRGSIVRRFGRPGSSPVKDEGPPRGGHSLLQCRSAGSGGMAPPAGSWARAASCGPAAVVSGPERKTRCQWKPALQPPGETERACRW